MSINEKGRLNLEVFFTSKYQRIRNVGSTMPLGRDFIIEN